MYCELRLIKFHSPHGRSLEALADLDENYVHRSEFYKMVVYFAAVMSPTYEIIRTVHWFRCA